MRVATIDIGTNSVLLLIADVHEDGITPRHQQALVTRLGEGVDETGALAGAAIERTVDALRGYAERIEREGVERAAAVATSALRDAPAHEPFLDRAERVLGFRPQVISGAEEADLTFDGSLLGLPLVPGRVAICDVGGGSTELMLGRVGADAAASLERAVSLDVGCVRLTERLIGHDPPLEQELRAVRAEARRAWRLAPDFAGWPLVATAGTATTLAAVIHRVWPYDPSRIHGARLSRSAVGKSIESLASTPLAQRQLLPALEPGRADIIVAGALLLDELMAHGAARELTVSDRGLRWGLAKRLAGVSERRAPVPKPTA